MLFSNTEAVIFQLFKGQRETDVKGQNNPLLSINLKEFMYYNNTNHHFQ